MSRDIAQEVRDTKARIEARSKELTVKEQENLEEFLAELGNRYERLGVSYDEMAEIVKSEIRTSEEHCNTGKYWLRHLADFDMNHFNRDLNECRLAIALVKGKYAGKYMIMPMLYYRIGLDKDLEELSKGE